MNENARYRKERNSWIWQIFRNLHNIKTPNMKSITLIAAIAATTFFYAQEVRTTEENVAFSNGSHNAIVVTVPYGKKEIVEKELKSEMKDWGGKYNSSKGEMTTVGSSSKAIGEKPYDGYAKIISDNATEVKVAFAVDLGGAYLNSSQHGTQYSAVLARVKQFAVRAAGESVEAEMDAEAKVLKTMEGDQSDLQKSIENSREDIEECKKRIADAEQKIRENEAAVARKGDEIAAQKDKIGTIEKKKKSIK